MDNYMWVKFASGNQTNETMGNYWTTMAPIDMAPRYATVIQFSIIGSSGVIINLLPMLVTALGFVDRNVVNSMIVNLAFTEFLLCVSFVFGQSFFVLWHEWLPSGGCHFLSFLHFVAAFASFMFPPLLAINRYIALYKPDVYDDWFTARRVALMIGLGWSFCSIVPFAFFLGGKTGYDEDNDHCCMVVDDKGWMVAYWLLIIMPLLALCDGLMVYCNYKIYIKLKQHALDAKEVANVVSEHRELLYFLFVDMMLPICFHSVYHVFKFIITHRTSEFLKRFFISLYLINSILRGVITIVMLRPYRRAVRRLLCCKSTVTHTTTVHPARTNREIDM